MPTTHREVERKYYVDDNVALPTLEDLPDVSRVDGPRTDDLEARYFDTDDLALGRRGITLRRRTGGTDPGWHLKLPVDGARQEIHAPLGRSVRTPPVALRRVVQEVVRQRALLEIATITTQRTTATVVDADATVLAEVSDDVVTAVRSGADGEETHRWREWEIEIHAGRPRLTKALDKRARKAGAEVASGRSKLGQLMQLGVEAPSTGGRNVLDEKATEHELLTHHVTGLVDDLHRLDPMARADLPGAVYQLRLVIRRLRSVLRSFDLCFDAGITDPVRDELHWISDVLGRPRDLDVLRSEVSSVLLGLHPDQVRDRPGTWFDRRLRAERRTAHQEVLAAMTSERYFTLLDTIDGWQAGLPFSDRRDRRARKSFPKVIQQEWRRVEKAVGDAEAADDAERPDLLHQVRKKSKRVRYAAEALEPVASVDTRAAAKRAKKVQEALGEHHDVLLAMQHVLHLAAAARDEGRDTFTWGVVVARLEAEITEHEREFRRSWKKVR